MGVPRQRCVRLRAEETALTLPALASYVAGCANDDIATMCACKHHVFRNQMVQPGVHSVRQQLQVVEVVI